VLEVKEEAIPARGRERGLEADRAAGAVVVGVDVEEREVAVAQRDEVAVGAEVALDADGPAGLGDREAQLRVPAGARRAAVEADVVAAAGLGRRGRRGQRPQVGVAIDAQVAGERRRRALAHEVSEDAVGAGVAEAQRRRPRAVGIHRRVQVLEGRQVAAGDDQVHALRVPDVEVAHRAAAGVDDPEAQPLGRAPAHVGILDDEAQAVLGDGQAPQRWHELGPPPLGARDSRVVARPELQRRP
jgi:hypothetical protein